MAINDPRDWGKVTGWSITSASNTSDNLYMNPSGTTYWQPQPIYTDSAKIQYWPPAPPIPPPSWEGIQEEAKRLKSEREPYKMKTCHLCHKRLESHTESTVRGKYSRKFKAWSWEHSEIDIFACGTEVQKEWTERADAEDTEVEESITLGSGCIKLPTA